MEGKKVKNEVIVTGIYEQFWEKKIKKERSTHFESGTKG